MANTLVQDIITGWVTKIANKMRSSGTSHVEFSDTTDFNKDELPWIQKVLIPALKDHGMVGRISRYKAKGDGVGCDCYSSVCEHSTGRLFIVDLKVE